MNGIRLYRVLLCALLLGLTSVALAQEATIVGSVTDQSGLAIPNATITLLNSETGQSQTVSSNDVGQFVVPALHIGSYSITAEATGFRPWSQTGLTLRVGDRARVDIQMH